MTSSLLGVVLCGGLSTRMGTDKAAMKHPRGGTFLSRSVDRMRQVTSEVVVAGTCSVIHDCQSVEDWPTENSATMRGPILGVIAALHLAEQKGITACLVTAVDTPLLKVADLQKLVDQWKRNDGLVVATTIQSIDSQIASQQSMKDERSSHRATQRLLENTLPLAVGSDAEAAEEGKAPPNSLPATNGNDTRIQPLIAVYPTSISDGLLTAVGRGQRSLYRSIISVSHTAVELSPASCRNINTPDDYRDICASQTDPS